MGRVKGGLVVVVRGGLVRARTDVVVDDGGSKRTAKQIGLLR